jgi:RNA polymerase sigma-70 factor (ECF subfamily)
LKALAQLFLREGEQEHPSALESEVAGVLDRAHKAWPSIHLTDERFAEELAARVPPEEEVMAALRAMHVEDVYLAVGCASGDAAALQEFERHCVPEIRATLGRLGLSATVLEETTQVMREELLVQKESAPARILNYAGGGPLRAWLRSVAARTGLRVLKKEPSGRELRESMSPAANDDLELEYLKQKYGGSFNAAFQEALGAMPIKDRLLLKQRLRHQLSIEELGELYGVHPSTISRRVADARERLVADTRDVMMRELNIGRAEVSSILRLIHSNLDITLSLVE